MLRAIFAVAYFCGRTGYKLVTSEVRSQTVATKQVPVRSNTRQTVAVRRQAVVASEDSHKRDNLLLVIIAIALLVSVVSFIYYYTNDLVLVYKDAQSHLLIAKRVVDSPTPGLAQLGGVWPPLPHLLMQPLIWNDYLYETGIAGSIPSMLCFVGTSVFLYKITLVISGSRWAGVVASLVFVANPNVGYMQSTAMTELPLCMFLSGSVYFFIRWTQKIDEPVSNIVYGLATTLMLICATMTRYEGWILLALFVPLWGVVCINKRMPKERVEGEVFFLTFLASLGIVGWLIWNFQIFGNPFYFQYGEYAKPSLWVGEGEQAVGNFWVALKTYSIATYETAGAATLFFGLIGLAYFVVSDSKNIRKAPVYALLFPFPFFVAALYLGQRPLHVEQVTGDLYNVRFSLPMILPLAIFAGYLTKNFVISRVAIVGGVCAFSVFVASQGEIITLNEPKADMEKPLSVTQRDAGYWLSQNYTSGVILMESYGNEELQVSSKLPIRAILYEGSYRMWEPALTNPAKFVDWVVMRSSQANQDKVYRSLNGTEALDQHYLLVFSNEQIQIYQRKELIE